MHGNLKIEYLPLDRLTESPTNSRKHTRSQIRKIADSIVAFGFLVAIVIDEYFVVLAGHGRLAAARLLGLDTVPVVQVRDLTEAQRRAFTVADNKLTDLSSFDAKKLAIEFEYMLEIKSDFSIEDTGFDIVEVDRLLGFDHAGDEEELVELPSEAAKPVSWIDDCWVVGENRILCGNALECSSAERLFPGERAGLTFTDPPYNVPIQGNVSGLGAKVHGDFAMACGEMSRAQFTYQFLRPVFEIIRDFSNPGAIAFVCMDWRHSRDVENAAEGVFHEHKNTIVWVKGNAGLGSFYRSQHEFVLAFTVSRGPLRNNFGLGGKGRHRTNVWQYPGANTFRAGRMEDLASHPTVKNLKMTADALLDCSAPGDIIFDPFLGSGTTALAATRCGRRCYGIEIEPTYADLIVNRLSAATGLVARLDTGESFAEVAAARGVVIGEQA